MDRRKFLKTSTLTISGLMTDLSFLFPKISTPTTHIMTGPFASFIYEENGEMFCHDMCDCGCVNKKWKIKEHDIIVAHRPILGGNLKNLDIHATSFELGTKYRPVNLINCKLYPRNRDKYPYSL